MSGWTEADVQRVRDRQAGQEVGHAPGSGKARPTSKYRNQRVVINGEKFDSKREASYYQELLFREKMGSVRNIQRQVTFHLCCPELDAQFRQAEIPKIVYVADYVADFTFDEVSANAQGVMCLWEHVVVDVKGAKTAMYLLKKKWLELQSGIVIREVRCAADGGGGGHGEGR